MTLGHFQCISVGDTLFGLIQGFLVHGEVVRFLITPERIKAAELSLETGEKLILPYSDLYRTREAALYSLVHFHELRAHAIRALLPADRSDDEFWE